MLSYPAMRYLITGIMGIQDPNAIVFIDEDDYQALKMVKRNPLNL